MDRSGLRLGVRRATVLTQVLEKNLMPSQSGHSIPELSHLTLEAPGLWSLADHQPRAILVASLQSLHMTP